MSNVRRHEVDAQLRRWPDCEFLLENISSQKQPTNFVLYAFFFLLFCFASDNMDVDLLPQFRLKNNNQATTGQTSN